MMKTEVAVHQDLMMMMMMMATTMTIVVMVHVRHLSLAIC
jgi:hypothetical protein